MEEKERTSLCKLGASLSDSEADAVILVVPLELEPVARSRLYKFCGTLNCQDSESSTNSLIGNGLSPHEMLQHRKSTFIHSVDIWI